jgi:hypothetical protein
MDPRRTTRSARVRLPVNRRRRMTPPELNDSTTCRAHRRPNPAPIHTAQIGMAVGAVLDCRKMAKHFAVDIRDGHLSFKRKVEQINDEARLDGIYVIRTSMPVEHLDAKETVQNSFAPSREFRPPISEHAAAFWSTGYKGGSSDSAKAFSR